MKSIKITSILMTILLTSILIFGCSDDDNLPETEKPNVTITNLPDLIITTSFVFTAQIMDNKGVTSVILHYTNPNNATYSITMLKGDGDTWQVNWIPENFVEGSYIFTVEAADRAGNIGTAQGSTTFQMPEFGVSFVSPQNNSFAYGESEVVLEPYGALQLQSIEILLNDNSQGIISGEPWNLSINLSSLDFNSTVEITAKASFEDNFESETSTQIFIGAKPVALAELFTGTWCINCPEAEAELHHLGEEYHGQLAVMEYHVAPPPDPFNIPEVSTRFIYYSTVSCPTAMFGGTEQLVNGTEEVVSQYEGKVQDILSTPKKLEVLVSGDFSTGVFDVNVIAAALDLPGNLMLRTAIMEDGREYDEDVYNSIVRDMGADISLNPFAAISDVQNQQITFEMDPDWVVENLYVVAFVQSEDSKEVIQTGILLNE